MLHWQSCLVIGVYHTLPRSSEIAWMCEDCFCGHFVIICTWVKMPCWQIAAQFYSEGLGKSNNRGHKVCQGSFWQLKDDANSPCCEPDKCFCPSQTIWGLEVVLIRRRHRVPSKCNVPFSVSWSEQHVIQFSALPVCQCESSLSSPNGYECDYIILFFFLIIQVDFMSSSPVFLSESWQFFLT